MVRPRRSPVERAAFRVDAALREDAPDLSADALIEAAPHGLTLPDARHGNRLQLVVSLLHLIRRVPLLLKRLLGG